MVDSPERNAIIGTLASKGIETQVGYYALHLQDAFRGLRRVGSLENSSRAFISSLALPMYIGLRKRDQRLVADALIEAVKGVD
jgi:dTDP-4-amino-4,6-dideoxygalactose transaminase